MNSCTRHRRLRSMCLRHPSNSRIPSATQYPLAPCLYYLKLPCCWTRMITLIHRIRTRSSRGPAISAIIVRSPRHHHNLVSDASCHPGKAEVAKPNAQRHHSAPNVACSAFSKVTCCIMPVPKFRTISWDDKQTSTWSASVKWYTKQSCSLLKTWITIASHSENVEGPAPHSNPVVTLTGK